MISIFRLFPTLLASNEGYRRAEDLLRQALERDPNYADALAALADCIARRYLNGWQSDLNQTRLEVAHFAERAVDAGPHNAYAIADSAWAYAVILGQIAGVRPSSRTGGEPTIDQGAGPCRSKAMARHRIHSLAFKKQVVQEYAAGATLNALAREHDLSRT